MTAVVAPATRGDRRRIKPPDAYGNYVDVPHVRPEPTPCTSRAEQASRARTSRTGAAMSRAASRSLRRHLLGQGEEDGRSAANVMSTAWMADDLGETRTRPTCLSKETARVPRASGVPPRAAAARGTIAAMRGDAAARLHGGLRIFDGETCSRSPSTRGADGDDERRGLSSETTPSRLQAGLRWGVGRAVWDPPCKKISSSSKTAELIKYSAGCPSSRSSRRSLRADLNC